MNLFSNKCPLYAIIDQETLLKYGTPLTDFVHALQFSGIEIFQYRDKISSKSEWIYSAEMLVKTASQSSEVIFNDNRFPAPSHKLHLGQEDGAPPTNTLYFGRSTHNKEEIEIAMHESRLPDYIGFGSMFTSTIKPELQQSLSKVSEAVTLWNGPIVFIGGISLVTLPVLMNQIPASAQSRSYFAIISAFFSEGENARQIERAAARLCTIGRQGK